MMMDVNTSAIVIAVITLVVSPIVSWLIARDLKKSATISQEAVVIAVAEVAKKADIISTNINGMQDKLLKAKDTAAVAQVEAASLAGEQRGREEGTASAVVQTVKGSNGELAALKKDIKTISEKLVEVSLPATPLLDLAALAKMLAAELKKDQK